MFQGFGKEDFNIFTIEGLQPRMDAIISQVRPKLEELGTHFSASLSGQAGEELFAHVAKHARRSVNPPDDTWVAFANSKRGYKKLPHFQIGLWETHVFVWFAVIYESPVKKDFGTLLEEKQEQIAKMIPKDYVWSDDHTKPDVLPFKDMDKEDMQRLFTRLQNVKKAELLCGITIPREDIVEMDAKQQLSLFESTFQTLMPLYQMGIEKRKAPM
ncbi:DUF1054 family protein [Bacillus lacus]|uniref:UPF0637 protein GJU40_05720 n=1 Tax=Metabacillus lacus TaxID=1983721 RepID=A0A7X2IXK3_9BACI|nr:DUF1054 domain-containing protein [Metabacillus lacus]MRX71672.1 DUF1054 family protein [Metabacillus lacus]